MDFEDYLSCVQTNFSAKEDWAGDRYTVARFYEEKFELKWIATKLKIFSFVAYLPEISARDIQNYSAQCLARALEDYKGLPRGVQNGVVCFNVLASEKIDPEAISFAKARPKKHFAAMEMPVLFNLSADAIHYYEKTPIWGAIYYRFFREYIDKNFNLR